MIEVLQVIAMHKLKESNLREDRNASQDMYINQSDNMSVQYSQIGISSVAKPVTQQEMNIRKLQVTLAKVKTRKE